MRIGRHFAQCLVAAATIALTWVVASAARAQPCDGIKLYVTRAVTGSGWLQAVRADSADPCFHESLGMLPGGVTTAPNGNIYVWIQSTGPLVEYDHRTGAQVRIVVQQGAGGALQGRGVKVMPGGDILVAGGGSHRVARFSGTTGAFLGDFIPAGTGGLSRPLGLTYGPNGNLFVSSSDTGEIMEYDGETGAFVGAFVAAGAGGLENPYDLTFGPDGHLYVTDYLLGIVRRFDGASGAPLGTFTDTALPTARGLAFGPNGNLFLCTWQSPAGVYEFDGTTGDMIGQFTSGAASFMLTFGGCGPWIRQHPEDVTVPIGGTAALGVTADGDRPVSYQWRKDGAPIPGATFAFFSFPVVTDASAGTYDVQVTDACGHTTSRSARLRIGCGADFDGNGVLNVNDFVAFRSAFLNGCP